MPPPYWVGLALRPKAGGGRRGDGPTLQLPQEGDIGEAHYVLDAVPASELLGIGRTKIKLDGDKARPLPPPPLSPSHYHQTT